MDEGAVRKDLAANLERLGRAAPGPLPELVLLTPNGYIMLSSWAIPDGHSYPAPIWLADLGPSIWIAYLAAGLAILALSWPLEPNANSLHCRYRDRLGDAFLFDMSTVRRQSAANDATDQHHGVAPADESLASRDQVKSVDRIKL